MKKFLIILIIIFICGILSADICMQQMKESNAFIGLEGYKQYANAKLTFQHVFWNIMYERVKLLGIVVLLCFTPLKERMGLLLGAGFCFIWGFFLMSCIIELGVAGLVVGLASVLPHGILYGVAIGFLLGGGRARRYQHKNQIARKISVYLFVLLLFVTACVIESLIGTHFIPWIIRLSLI